MENNALIVIDTITPDMFTPDKIKPVLSKISDRAKELTESLDPGDPDGCKEIVSVAYQVSRSKTFITGKIDESLAEYKKKMDAGRAVKKIVTTELDALRDETRSPVTELEEAEAKAKAEEAERERQKNLKRVFDMQAVGKVVDIVAMAMLTDAEYEDIYCTAKAEWQAEQERLAEEAREREAEAKRLADERAELEKLRAEQAERDRIEREKLDAERRAIEAEKAKIEAEKKAELERRDREEFERHAKIRAEQDAKAKVEREAREAEARRIASEKAAEEKRIAEEAEKARQETMKPDKEKLLAFADKIHALTENNMDLASKEAHDIFDEIIGELMDTENDFRVYIERL